MASSGQEGAECTTFWRLGAFMGSVSEAVTYRLPLNFMGTWVTRAYFVQSELSHPLFADAESTHCPPMFDQGYYMMHARFRPLVSLMVLRTYMLLHRKPN